MNILYCDLGSFTYRDILSQLKEMGHNCKLILYRFSDMEHDSYYHDYLSQELTSAKYDFVFSIDFIPLIAEICKERHIKYASWVYDSPINTNHIPYFEYETNYIFLFDRLEVIKYQQMGITRVFHLPLAVNTSRIDNLLSQTPSEPYLCDVSFVGQLYSSSYIPLVSVANPYTQGFLEGILQAQMRVYGYNLLDDVIPDEIVRTLDETHRKLKTHSGPILREALIHEMHRYITHFERTFLLEEMGARFNTFLYSQSQYSFSSPVQMKGPIEYYNVMPQVFRKSKINLCPTLRSILSGIPQRCLDIMASGGLLLANFQPELAEYFENEVDVLMYESMEDAIAKATFYLKNDSLRKKIAQNGYQKTKELFNYPRQFTTLFEILNNN